MVKGRKFDTSPCGDVLSRTLHVCFMKPVSWVCVFVRSALATWLSADLCGRRWLPVRVGWRTCEGLATGVPCDMKEAWSSQMIKVYLLYALITIFFVYFCVRCFVEALPLCCATRSSHRFSSPPSCRETCVTRSALPCSWMTQAALDRTLDSATPQKAGRTTPTDRACTTPGRSLLPGCGASAG